MITTETGNKRLLKLADFLDKLPVERFDFGSWTGRDWKGAQNLSCGTTACALGWAATMPKFRRLGVHLSTGGVPQLREYDKNLEWEIFAIDSTDAFMLFYPKSEYAFWGMPDWYGFKGLGTTATPHDVAELFRRYVAHRRRREVAVA